jgi:hypothetical protein
MSKEIIPGSTQPTIIGVPEPSAGILLFTKNTLALSEFKTSNSMRTV